MSTRIEFCGVPASGKSTLCAGALRLLWKRGKAVLDRGEMVNAGLCRRDFGLFGNFLSACVPGWRREFLGLPHGLNDWHRFVVNHPDFASLLHGYLAEREAGEIWRSAVFYALLISGFEFQLSLVAKYPVLLDEGFAQRFFSLRGYRGLGRLEDAARYAAAMPLPSALIWVVASPEICMERVKRRAHIPLLQQTEIEPMLPVRFSEGNAMLAGLAAELEGRGVSVLRVDGTGDLKSEAMKIADFVEPLL